MESAQSQIAVVGAGLVGCYMALLLAQEGMHIDLFEARRGLVTQDQGRTINLIMNQRGISALKRVGIELTSEEAVKLQGLWAAYPNGAADVHEFPHGCQYSIKRNALIKRLEEKVTANPLITYYPGTRISEVCTSRSTVTIMIGSISTESQYEAIFACDGGCSEIRNKFFLTSPLGIDYQQNYSELKYMEFQIPTHESLPRISPQNYLHTYPSLNGGVFASFPNCDQTATLVLFMKEEKFNEIHDEKDFYKLLEKEYSALTPIFSGLEEIVRQRLRGPRKLGRMCTVRLGQWRLNKTILLGDGAHQMLPFLGYGFNTSSENCERILDLHRVAKDWAVTFAMFEKEKRPIVSQMQNMSEMGAMGIQSTATNKELQIIWGLEKKFKDKFISLQSLLSSTNIKTFNFSQMLENEKLIVEKLMALKSDTPQEVADALASDVLDQFTDFYFSILSQL